MAAIAEWSKALIYREKINEHKKDPRLAHWPGQTLKNHEVDLEIKSQSSEKFGWELNKFAFSFSLLDK